MKKSNKQSAVGHFFKHYFGLLCLALVCGLMAVLLIGFVAGM